MTKEIIIDGIDVSECDFLWKEKLPKKVCNNGNLDCNCNSNPNCDFKQLKRKERECEELINEKAEIKKYLGISDKTIIQRLEELQEFKDKLKISEYNYKQALDEIEKIVSADYYDDSWGTLAIKIDSIKEIINKAKED